MNNDSINQSLSAGRRQAKLLTLTWRNWRLNRSFKVGKFEKKHWPYIVVTSKKCFGLRNNGAECNFSKQRFDQIGVKSFRLLATFCYRSCHGNDNGPRNSEQSAPVQIFINQRRLVLNIVKLSFWIMIGYFIHL